jgi:hypothetical protein
MGDPMKRKNLPSLLSAIVTLTGLTVMAGWIFDVPILKSILPVWVTMKFVTALSFVLSGIVLWSIACELKGKECLAQVLLPVCALSLFLIMFTLLVSSFLGIRTGIEDLFVRESAFAVGTTTPGRPSIVTMFSFCLVATAGAIVMLKPRNTRKILFVFGMIVAFIGALGVLGYLLNVPWLFYSVKGISTAMACHTAILFVLLGIGLCASTRS